MRKRAIISLVLTAGAMFGTYKLWHHASVLIFISLLILSFLLAYKITDYIADFKTIKNNSIIDIVFLIIFFVMLCIPASHISNAKIAKGEHRYLAPKAVLIKQKNLNLNFGKEFNEWFNDRFTGRNMFMHANAYFQLLIENKIEITNNIYLTKTQKFLQKSLLPDKLLLSPAEINKASLSLQKLNKFCEQNGIKLYVLIVPTNNLINYKDWTDYISIDALNKYNEQIEYIGKKSGVCLIYLYNELLNFSDNKNNIAYYHTDNHWTEDAAYLGYEILINTIKKDFKDIEIFDKKKLPVTYSTKIPTTAIPETWGDGNLYRPFLFCKNLIKYSFDTKYRFYGEDSSLKKVIEVNSKYKGYDFEYKDGNHKVMLIGSSMNNAMLKFLPYSFKQLKFIRLNSSRELKGLERYKLMKHYHNNILEYKPEILIYSVASDNVKEHISQIFEE